MDKINVIFGLMIAFEIKHYLSDFTFQTTYMQGKAKKGWDWVLPLTAHCAVHSAFTLLIILVYKPSFFWIALIDFLIHFIIDKIKSSYKLKEGIWEISEKGKLLSKYYQAFGLDQMAHHLTYYVLIYLMI